MSILDEVETEASFDAKNEGFSRNYKRLIEIAKRNFEAFCIKNCEGRTIKQTFAYIKKLPKAKREPTLYHVLKTWVNGLEKNKTSATVRNYFGVIKKIARHEGFKISNEDFKENVKIKKPIKETKYVLTLDDIHLILKDSTWKKKGFYLFLLSSGMRPKEAFSLRKKHISQLANGMYLIKLPASITKTGYERDAFVSREVYPFLTRILRGKNDNDLIWTGQENSDYAVITADTTFRNLCNRIGLTQKYETGNRHKLNLYCFRGFFYAKASMRHGDEYAHKMIGHTGYLPQYDRKTTDERLTMYLDYENELITDQTQKLRVENDKLKEKENTIDEMKGSIGTLYDVLHKLTTDDTEAVDGDEVRKMIEGLKKYSK